MEKARKAKAVDVIMRPMIRCEVCIGEELNHVARNAAAKYWVRLLT